MEEDSEYSFIIIDDDSSDSLFGEPGSQESREVPQEEEEVQEVSRQRTMVLEPPSLQASAVNDIDNSRQIQGVKFFLTYPQCAVSAASALAKIEEKFQGVLEWAVCAEELHADGTPHLHCVVYFRQRYSYTDRRGRFWDFVTGQHGNYQRVRDIHAVLRYVIKGGYFVSTLGFDPAAFLSSKTTKRSHQGEQIARAVLGGNHDLLSLAKQYPGWFATNLRRAEDLSSFVQSHERLASPSKPFPSVLPDDMPVYLAPIHAWILQRSQADPSDRDFKHLRIVGPTGLGKSSLIHALRSYFKIYDFPYGEDFLCDFDDSYDFVLMDEFNAQVMLTFLNQFCDGFGQKLKRKGRGTYLHCRKVPIVLLTNFEWDVSYHKVAQLNPAALAPTQRRFEDVYLSEEQPLFSLINFYSTPYISAHMVMLTMPKSLFSADEDVVRNLMLSPVCSFLCALVCPASLSESHMLL